jgi:maltose alpha-D-glucosyltransferase/alpha-amylase
VEYGEGGRETYVLTLAHATGEAAERIRTEHRSAIVCAITTSEAAGVVHDALVTDQGCYDLFGLILDRETRRGASGTVTGVPGDALADARGTADGLAVARSSGEQSNTSIIFGDRFIMKVFRRLEFGPNPDGEMTRYLSEVRGFDGVPPYAGQIEYRRPLAGSAAIGLLQGLVEHQGDGWLWMLDELGRYYERVATIPSDDLLAFAEHGTLVELAQREFPPGLDEALGISDDAALVLGRRTAQMHLALAQPGDDPAFAPEPFDAAQLGDVVARVRDDAASAFNRLRDLLPSLADDITEIASGALSIRSRIVNRIATLEGTEPGCQRIRVHGDYHLGQVLRAATDFAIIDFEGEPTRPLAERRRKQCALKDVAGMLRSFSYAARFALMSHEARRAGGEDRLRAWARLWERSVHSAFLRAYRETAGNATFLPREPRAFANLLELYLLDKLVYELRYELDNRPTWVRIPLAGIVQLEADEQRPS